MINKLKLIFNIALVTQFPHIYCELYVISGDLLNEAEGYLTNEDGYSLVSRNKPYLIKTLTTKKGWFGSEQKGTLFISNYQLLLETTSGNAKDLLEKYATDIVIEENKVAKGYKNLKCTFNKKLIKYNTGKCDNNSRELTKMKCKLMRFSNMQYSCILEECLKGKIWRLEHAIHGSDESILSFDKKKDILTIGIKDCKEIKDDKLKDLLFERIHEYIFIVPNDYYIRQGFELGNIRFNSKYFEEISYKTIYSELENKVKNMIKEKYPDYNFKNSKIVTFYTKCYNNSYSEAVGEGIFNECDKRNIYFTIKDMLGDGRGYESMKSLINTTQTLEDKISGYNMLKDANDADQLKNLIPGIEKDIEIITMDKASVNSMPEFKTNGKLDVIAQQFYDNASRVQAELEKILNYCKNPKKENAINNKNGNVIIEKNKKLGSLNNDIKRENVINNKQDEKKLEESKNLENIGNDMKKGITIEKNVSNGKVEEDADKIKGVEKKNNKKNNNKKSIELNEGCCKHQCGSCRPRR